MSQGAAARRVWACVSMLLSISLLVACGGGGGAGGQPAASPTAQQTQSVRQFGDNWSEDATKLLYTGSGATTQSEQDSYEYAVDVQRPDGSYGSSRTDVASGAVITSSGNAAGHQLMSGGCAYLPAQTVYPDQLALGQTWQLAFTRRCTNEDVVQSSGSVDSEATFTMNRVAYRVLNVHYTLTGQPVGEANIPAFVDAHCQWSPDLHLNLHCSIDYTYAANAMQQGTLQHEDFSLTRYAAGTGSSPVAQAASAYPAFHPTMPQVKALDPAATPVLATPSLVPVLFSNTSDGDAKVAFLGRLVASSNWQALKEYGVGAATVAPTVSITTTAPTALTDADVQSWLQARVSDGTIKPDPNTYVILYYPPATQVQVSAAGAKTCVGGGPGGFHNVFKLKDGSSLPYAVIPNCVKGAGRATTVVSHEVLEGVVDPSVRGIRNVAGDISWALVFGGAEIGDMCEHLENAGAWSTDGDRIARVWSNQAAAAYHDACVPSDQPDGPGFYSVPVLNDVLQLQANGAGGVAHGVAIPPGGQVSIPVQLLSDGPTYGDWRVSVQAVPDINGATPVSFALDRRQGHNGDVLHLNIQMPQTPLPDGVMFKLVSSLGGRTSIWTGVVGNTAARTTLTKWVGSSQTGAPKDGQGSAAVLSYVYALAVNTTTHQLLLADGGLTRVVDSSGQVGTANGALSGVEAVAVDARGTDYLLGYRQSSDSDVMVNRFLQSGRPDLGWTTPSVTPDVIASTTTRSQGLVIGPDGLPYMVEPTRNQVLRFANNAWQVWAGQADGSSGDATGSLSEAAFNRPSGLAFDTRGNLYVSDTGNHKIRQITPQGDVLTYAGDGTYAVAGGLSAQARFANPTALAFDARTGGLYLLDSGFLRVVDASGLVSTLAGGDLGCYPTALATDGAGQLYLGASGGFSGVLKVTPGR